MIFCRDDEGDETTSVKAGGGGVGGERVEGMPVGVGAGTIVATGKGFFDVPSSQPAIEYKKGYVMRKSCIEPNGKKSVYILYCAIINVIGCIESKVKRTCNEKSFLIQP